MLSSAYYSNPRSPTWHVTWVGAIPQGPSARKTSQQLVSSEARQAPSCPCAYFQNHFPNARSAAGSIFKR